MESKLLVSLIRAAAVAILFMVLKRMFHRIVYVSIESALHRRIKYILPRFVSVYYGRYESDSLKLKESHGDGYTVMHLESVPQNGRSLLIVPAFPETFYAPAIQQFVTQLAHRMCGYDIDVLIHDGSVVPSEKSIIDHYFLDTEAILAYLSDPEHKDSPIIAFELSCRKVLELIYRRPEIVSKCMLVNCNFDWFTLNDQYLGRENARLGALLYDFYQRNKAILDAQGTPELINKFQERPTLSSYDEAFYYDFYQFECLEDFYATIYANPAPESIICPCLVVNDTTSPLVSSISRVELRSNQNLTFIKLKGRKNAVQMRSGARILAVLCDYWLGGKWHEEQRAYKKQQ